MLEDDPLIDPDDLGDLGDLGDPGDLGDIPPTLIELEKIPRRLWEQTLAPLHRQQRMWLALQVSDERLREVASMLAFELDMAECGRRKARDEARFEARRTGAPLPTPHAEHAVTRSTVQVTFACAATITRA